MFKSAEQVATFINKLETYIDNIIYVKTFASQGMDEAAKATIPMLNKRRTELEEFIMVACGISVASDTTDTYLCPDCGSEMKERRNRENGNKFYGCVKFPNCRGTRDENGLSRADREERKYKQEQVSQQSGFSFNREKRNPVTEVSPPKTSFNPFEK
jgi:hypothetical protein